MKTSLSFFAFTNVVAVTVIPVEIYITN